MPDSSNRDDAERAQLLEEESDGGWRGCIAGGIGGDDFDEVFAEVGVNDDQAAGTEKDVLQFAVDVNVVTDIRLGIEVVGGLGPLNVGLGAAVAGAARKQVCGRGRWRGVVGIRRRSGHGDGIAEGRAIVAVIVGSDIEGVSGFRFEETDGR